jgi:signal transduction histidine kinase
LAKIRNATRRPLQLIETVRTTGSGRVELAVPTRAGQSILMEVDATAMHAARSGQFSGAMAVMRDISVSRLMQNQLRASEQRLKAVLEHMPVGVWLLNREGQIVMGNQAGQRLWAGARFVGLEYFGEYRARWLDTGELLKPEEWAGYRAVTYGEASINELLEIECFDGSRKVIRNSCIPFYDNGELLGAVAVNEDISDLRRTQDELKRYASELERSNRDLQDFAFVASHDLQEPMRKVKSFGALLQRRLKDDLDAETTTYLNRMQQAAERMQNMINDLLAYSRVTTHGQPFQAVPLEQALSEAIANLEGLVEQTGGQVSVLGPLPAVQGDHGQLRQLFQNLLSNALKFHRPGVPPNVTVQVCGSSSAAAPAAVVPPAASRSTITAI